ncbi:hypothetical protein [Candidatus Mycoplasma mahonii]|uniref:hypothetical protein n=1 Tax=Candidatus Mycoplasma mahonii TaxID=3004105 RepID=UPI0026EB957E|nr:hypothetical protein [Candidatus Mycoplasma mahonii]WKX02813.1 hypothetical protein O3I44_01940 [Candidatus Mycoplasma mahonii]
MKNRNNLEISINKIYMKVYTKYLKSRLVFIFLNVLLIAFVSLMIIINLFAIKKNVFDSTKIYYVVIAIGSTLIGLLTSMSAFMLFRKNGITAKEQYKNIKLELKAYKASIGKYKINEAERQQLFIEEIHKISDNH